MTISKLPLILLAALAQAATIQYVGQFPVPGYDVPLYTGPNQLTMDGTPILGTSITPDVKITGPWNATLEPLSWFPTHNQEAPMILEAEWINREFLSVNFPDLEWSGMQHAIWNLFGADYTDPLALEWDTLAASNWPSVDPNSFQVLVPDFSTPAQFMLVQQAGHDIPEPCYGLIVGAGLILGVRITRKRPK